MKRNFWRKTAAFTLALTLATGSLPANAPLQDLFSGAVLTAHAEVTYFGECGDNVTWSLEGGVLTISGTGAMEDFYDVDPWYNYRSGITEAVIESGVTSIGGYAFYECISLTEITIPDSVTSIGNHAFEWCSSLTEITIPDSVISIGYGAFNTCQNLTSVTIPDSVSSIGESAFCDCTSLTEVTIPDSVSSIGSFAFSSTPWLEAKREENPLVVVNGILIDGRTCSGAVTIPDSVTSIGGYAFYECISLTEITIPNSVTSIGEGAFSSCTNLTEITIPNSVTSIGGYAFDECISLTEITIPNSVTSIGEGAFSSCTNLTEITIPNSVTSIGGYAFDECISLKSVIIERAETLTALGSNAFVYYDYKTGSTAILPNVTIYVPAEKIEEYKHAENWSDYAERIIGYSDTQLPDGKYKQTAQKDGTYYTRFVFVVPKTDFAGKSKALFTATYNGTDYTYETSTYYTGVISNGVTYNPASSGDRAMFVVTVTSGSDISADLTCKLDFE